MSKVEICAIGCLEYILIFITLLGIYLFLQAGEFKKRTGLDLSQIPRDLLTMKIKAMTTNAPSSMKHLTNEGPSDHLSCVPGM